MARQPHLTVNVSSQQFQQFATQFNQLTAQMKNLNTQFGTITTSLNRSNLALRSMQSTVNTLNAGMARLFSGVSRVTKQFLSWSAIIGGVTALLGIGGSLYGIERLASSIMQKRRQALGLGQGYGRTQASAIFSQGLMSSPMETMQNIRMGMAGSPDQMQALMTMGINPFGRDAKLSPDEIMDKIVQKLPDLLKRAGPGKELLMAHAYGLDKLFADPMDLLRLSTEEGRKEYEMKRQLTKEYEKQLEIAPEALRAWTELNLQLQVAGATIESELGKKLADLASPLRHLSQAFTDLVKKFMDTPIVQRVIKRLAVWIDELATKMKALTTEDIDNFLEDIRKLLPSMEEFKATMHEFVEILKGAVAILHWMANFSPSEAYKQGTGPVAPGTVPASPGVVTGDPSKAPTIQQWWHNLTSGNWSKLLPGSNATQAPRTTDSTSKSPITTGTTSTGPAPAPTSSTFSPSSSLSMSQAFTANQRSAAGASLGSWSNMINAGKAGGFSFTGGSNVSGGNTNLGGPRISGGTTNLGGPRVSGGNTQSAINSFSNAATKMVPPPSSRGPSSVMGTGASTSHGGPRIGMSAYQMNRTASLVVRNVPGANVFMSAAGMVG